MGLWDSVCSIGSSIVSTVSSVVSSACSTISKFATTVGGPILGKMGTVGMIMQAVGTLFGFLNPNEKMEDLGDRSMQAADAGITPEKYDKYDEYMKEIRNFEIDPVKSESYTQTEKQLAGLAITCRGLEEKFDLRTGTMGMIAALIAMDKTGYFSSQRLEQWLKEPSLDKGKLVDLFDQKLTAKESYQMESQLIDLDKRNNPEKSEKDIESDLSKAKDSVQSYVVS